MLAGHRLRPQTLWVVLLSALWAVPAQGGDLEDALAAIEAGDFEAAVALLTPLAASDNTEALYLLGQLYEQGKGVEQDQEIAFDLYSVAALYGHAAAELRMEEFRNFAMNYEAVSKAAEWGNDEARFILGVMYLNGEIIEQDYEKAAYWFRKSFENPWGFLGRDGKIALAVMYHNGRGFPRDYVQACYLLEDAANIGNPFDVYNLEQEPINSLNERPDFEQSVAWFREAANKGDAGAQFCLAVAYFRGLVVEKDQTQTIRWLEKSAEGGDARGQYYLAHMFEEGSGVEKSDERAAFWFEKAALQDHADAQTMLGIAYFYGSGVPQDVEKTKYWLRKAIENGDTEASEFWGWLQLGELYPERLAGSFEDGIYTAPFGLFTAKYRLTGGSENDPCCQQTLDDSYDQWAGFATVVFSNEYGAINGVIYGGTSIIEELTSDQLEDRQVDVEMPPLQQWFYAVVIDLLRSNTAEIHILHEESRQFHGMDAWIAVASIPGGGMIMHYDSEADEQRPLDSVRGFVVFQRDELTYALMNENNVLSFCGAPRKYDPNNWDAFLDELSAFYMTMTFKEH